MLLYKQYLNYTFSTTNLSYLIFTIIFNTFVCIFSVLAVQNSNIPLQIIAVTESGGANAFFNSEICQFLITEGNSLADRCKGNFMTFSADQYVKCKCIMICYRLCALFNNN